MPPNQLLGNDLRKGLDQAHHNSRLRHDHIQEEHLLNGHRLQINGTQLARRLLLDQNLDRPISQNYKLHNPKYTLSQVIRYKNQQHWEHQ